MAHGCTNKRFSDGVQCILAEHHSGQHDYDDLRDSERFSEEERITANLRLQSVSPTGRTVLGVFAFLPPNWRGPVLLFAMAILGFLVGNKAPALVHWLGLGSK